MWALGCGFSDSPTGLMTLAECNSFLPTLKGLLHIFVERCGAPIDQRMEHGKTLLMFMAASGCLGAVEHVLSLGASVHMRDSEAWTPLMIACRGSEQVPNDQVAKASGAGEREQEDAERCAVIRALVAAGADMDAQNNNGLTALHLASMRLAPLLVKTLLECGATPDISCGGALSTPLLCAMQQRECNPDMADQCIAILKVMGVAKGNLTKALAQVDDEVVKAVKYDKQFINPLINIANEWKAKLDDEFSDPTTGELPEEESVGGHKSAAIQETEIAKAILRHFQMDPELLTTALPTSNWYEALHQKIDALTPTAYAKLYPTRDAPTEEEWAVLTASVLAEADSAEPEGERRAQALIAHPEGYGFVGKVFAANVHQLISAPMAHSVGFAVPNHAALTAIAALSPIIEVGLPTTIHRSHMTSTPAGRLCVRCSATTLNP